MSTEKNPFKKPQTPTPTAVEEPKPEVVEVQATPEVVEEAVVSPPAPVPAPANGGVQLPSVVTISSEIPDVISLNDEIKSDKLDNFNLEKGQVARIAFMVFDQSNAPEIRMNETWYYQAEGDERGTTFKAPKDKELYQKVFSKLGKASTKLGTIIFVYRTDGNGNYNGSAGDFGDSKCMIFGPKFFNQLREHHKTWGAGSIDFNVKCVDPKYKNWEIYPQKDRWFDSIEEAEKQDLLNKAMDNFNTKLPYRMGKPLNDEEIIAMLELNGPAAPSVPTPTASPFGATQDNADGNVDLSGYTKG